MRHVVEELVGDFSPALLDQIGRRFNEVALCGGMSEECAWHGDA